MSTEQPQISPEQEENTAQEQHEELFYKAVLPLADTTKGLHEAVKYPGRKRVYEPLDYLERIPAEKIDTKVLTQVLTNTDDTDESGREVSFRNQAIQDLTNLFNQFKFQEILN